jgi:hypothetical protein
VIRVIYMTVHPQTSREVMVELSLKADSFHVDANGVLTLARIVGDPVQREIVITFAPGVWRTCTDVGALAACIQAPEQPPSENPRRRRER